MSKRTIVRACCHCGSEDAELRPYGPGGRDVCFDCAMGTPERKAQTERAYSRQLGMAGPVALIDARDEVGPVPFAIDSQGGEGE